MQSIYSYSYCHHHLSYMGEEEVGNRLLMLGPSKQINKQSGWESSGLSDSLLTRSSRERQGKLCQGNIQLHVLLVIISALKSLPQTPCLPGSTWGQPTAADGLLLPAERQRLRTPASAPLAHSFFPFPAFFPAALETLAHSRDSSAH